MGRTLPTATMLFIQEQDNFSQFQRVLRCSDQLALNDLFVMMRNFTAASTYAAKALPLETFLLATPLEVYKEVILFRNAIEHLENEIKSIHEIVT